MRKRGLLLMVLAFLLGCTTHGQEGVKYERGFRFEVGIYLTFQHFKSNKPIPVSRIVTMEHLKDQPDYLKQILARKTFDYLDDNDSLRTVRSNDTWGFSTGHSVYFQPDVRIAIIGSICHFTAFVEYYFDPNMGTIGYQTAIGYGQQQEVIEFILDFETGQILRFSSKNMETILQRDPALFGEYKSSKGNKKQKNYLFLNRYNQAHPIYFPK